MFGTDEFLQTQVASAGRTRLHLMVVDRAIQQTRKVISGLESRDYELSHNSATRARDCMTELLAGLKVDPAPDLVKLVKDYFLHIQKNLVFADLLQDLEAAKKAMEMLEGYRVTWVELRSQVPD